MSDDCPSEDDKTLSNSGDLLGDDKDDTDIEDEIETFPATSKPKIGLNTEHERILTRKRRGGLIFFRPNLLWLYPNPPDRMLGLIFIFQICFPIDLTSWDNMP